MNPENLNNNENIDVLEPEVQVSEQDISNAKIETPTVKNEVVEIKKQGFFDRIKAAFNKADEKDQRIAEMKKQQEEKILSSLNEEQKGKYLAFRKKYGNDAYAQWDAETNDYKSPHSNTGNRH